MPFRLFFITNKIKNLKGQLALQELLERNKMRWGAFQIQYEMYLTYLIITCVLSVYDYQDVSLIMYRQKKRIFSFLFRNILKWRWKYFVLLAVNWEFAVRWRENNSRNEYEQF